MPNKPDLQPLIQHLCQSSDMTPSQARRAVDEVIAYFAETAESFVRRRHLEIKQETTLANPEIFRQIEAEMAQLVFAAPPLTQRQIRRIIYG
jgi:hypothetical protein